jgi:hypothetical protein
VTDLSRINHVLASQASSAHDPTASIPCTTAVQTIIFIVHFLMRKRATAGGKPQATTCRTSTSLTMTVKRPAGEVFCESDLHRRPRATVSPAPLSHRRVFFVLRNCGSTLDRRGGRARADTKSHSIVGCQTRKVFAPDLLTMQPVPIAGRLGSTFQRSGIASTLVNKTSPARIFLHSDGRRSNIVPGTETNVEP